VLKVLSKIQETFMLLSKSGKRYLFASAFIQVIISLLDVLGIGFIAGAAIFAVRVFGASTSATKENFFYSIITSITQDDRKSIFLLIILALLFFVSKTLLSSILFRKQLFFLTKRDSEFSESAIKKFLGRNLYSMNSGTTQEKITGMTTGLWLASSEILGNVIVILSEVGLLLLILLLLLVVDFQLAIVSIIYFLAVFLSLHFFLGRNLHKESLASTEAGLDLQNILKTILSSDREIRIFGREDYFSNKFLVKRKQYAEASANVLFLMILPKMFIEVALIVGVFLLFLFQVMQVDAVSAISTLSLYLVAGTRTLPSLLRLQNAISSVRASIPGVSLFLDLQSKQGVGTSDFPEASARTDSEMSPVEVLLSNVSYTYPDNLKPTITDFSFRTEAGSSCAILGDSGSGKSTLVDLILGLLSPDIGTVNLNSRFANSNIDLPIRVSYVPQKVSVMSGSIRDNISFGGCFSDSEIWESLTGSGLSAFVSSLPSQLDAQIEEDGLNLSGGQLQRLAISRALVNKPNLLILDEATSSLDSDSHDYINHVATALRNKVTLFSISHNWSSLHMFDQVILMKNGSKVYDGTFDEFKEQFSHYFS